MPIMVNNKRQLWIPKGFAHGFVVLSEMAGFLYKIADYYASEHERRIRWNDVDLSIDWQYGDNLNISEKDAHGASFKEAEIF